MSGRKPHLPTKPAFRERHAVLEASTCDESKSKILSLVLMMRLCATSILSYALMSGSISSPWFYSTLVKTRAVFRPYPLTSSGQWCPCCVLLYKKPFSTEFHRFFFPSQLWNASPYLPDKPRQFQENMPNRLHRAITMSIMPLYSSTSLLLVLFGIQLFLSCLITPSHFNFGPWLTDISTWWRTGFVACFD